jgi:hypothetical protein
MSLKYISISLLYKFTKDTGCLLIILSLNFTPFAITDTTADECAGSKILHASSIAFLINWISLYFK